MGIMIDQSYVPAHLAIEAMRDNGYKNTAYAVAELIDNSIQAGATHVQLLCAEKEEELPTRRLRKLNKIAILDNGIGMDTEVLKMALQFGNGTRLGRDKRTGIGRFGMGLPASSISQCRRVDVWSWQDGIENAVHIHLDVEEIKQGDRSAMPEPIKAELPRVWLKSGVDFEKTGTLVVWSKLDRLMWSKASTLIDNSELIIGRMYRKFLNENSTTIRLSSFDISSPNIFNIDKPALPNDPGYLMEKTCCPEPYHDKPMFNPFGEDNYERKFIINFQDNNHEVSVRLSYASEEAREINQAGATSYGQHAKKNIGISIVRAGRELELDQSLVIQHDTRERWWGIEVEFPPSLDELMGVTNNKQSARNFADIMELVDNELDIMLKSGKTYQQIKEELSEEGDPRVPLIEVANYIRNQLSVIRGLIKQQTRGTNSSQQRHETNNNPEKTATAVTDERKKLGYVGTSDKDETKSAEEKQHEIKEELLDYGVDEETAQQLAATTVTNNLKYLFAKSGMESDAFFSVNPRGGAINIALNTKHPAYENLIEVLEDDISESDEEKLRERLERASDGLKLLLMAWARYEDEQPDGKLKENAQDARKDWGRVAKNFLRRYE